MKTTFTIVSASALVLLTLRAEAQTQTFEVKPDDNPQKVLDTASPGSKLVFLPGLHQHPLGRHQSILYVDKSVDIELQKGAVLKLADHQTTLSDSAEITIDHGAPKKLNDLMVRGKYDKKAGRTYFAIYIDKEGADGKPDTFRWALISREVGLHGKYPNEKVPITGDWQMLSNGVQIKFASTTGHNRNSLWILSFGGRESYGIRIGHGTQENYIENVRIHGDGVIDMNQTNNAQPTEWVKDISACVLIHGRVRNVTVEQITMRDAMRSVMAYGEHTGKFLRGGGTKGGESFDAENISVLHTKTLNPTGKAYLLGHPSHRGRLTNVKCNYNFMVTAGTALEPNFNLDHYEVIGNVIKSGTLAIHCWRRSSNGRIEHNVRIENRPNHPVVRANSPASWEDPKNLTIRHNRVVKDLRPDAAG